MLDRPDRGTVSRVTERTNGFAFRFAPASAASFLWNFALAGFSAVIVLSFGALMLAHVDDKYLFDHTSAVWLELSRRTASGLFYPPLFDGTHYAGTRYMPLPILFPAGLSKVIGDALVSEKLLIYLSAVVTFGLVFWILRRRGCPPLVALALVAGVLATGTGLLAGTSIHWDTPATRARATSGGQPRRRRIQKTSPNVTTAER